MNSCRKKGYVLMEMMLGVLIVSILTTFVGSTLINVSLNARQARAEKELLESALNLESLIKTNLKNVNSLSHILFDGIIVEREDILNDKEYEVDGMAFGRYSKSTITAGRDNFVIAKDKGSSSTERKVLWFMKIGESEKLSEGIIRNRNKYEAGTYISKLYLERIDVYRYKMSMDLEYKGIEARHSFTFEIQ